MVSSSLYSLSPLSRILFPLLLAIAPHLAHSSRCRNPPVIFNFGDSNSDTGGIVAGIGIPIRPPNGRAFFRRPTGRFSDGRLVIDFLCSSFSYGANFAVAGSGTLPKNVPFSLNIQVMQFKHFKDRSSELASMGVEGLVNYDKFGSALYMIDIGQNDIADSFVKGMSYAQVVKNIPSILAEINNAIKAIYDEGGRKFWVHNTGPLGCLPQKLALAQNTSQSLDSFGCISSYNAAAKLFNEGLRRMCAELRSEMKGASIVYVDIFSIKFDLIANSTKHGFSNPLRACCGAGGAPYNYEKGVICGYTGYEVCEEGSRSVSWDGVHYTEAANSIVASKILSTDYSTPVLPFDFFCQ